jgi:hypothetical protein
MIIIVNVSTRSILYYIDSRAEGQPQSRLRLNRSARLFRVGIYSSGGIWQILILIVLPQLRIRVAAVN